MNERGISHIEVMLSFLIFIGFVIFAFYFFSPTQTSRIVESATSYAFREIIESTSTEVESYYVKMDVSDRSGIRKIKVKDFDFNKIENVRIENRHGVIVRSGREGNSHNIIFDSDAVHDGNPREGFAVFKINEDFYPGDLTSGGEPLKKKDYEIISSDKIEFVSEKRIRVLNASYYDDYEKLKQQFNMPSSVNFEFSIVLDSGEEIEAKRERPKGVEVFSNVRRIEVLREDGSVMFADLILRIW